MSTESISESLLASGDLFKQPVDSSASEDSLGIEHQKEGGVEVNSVPKRRSSAKRKNTLGKAARKGGFVPMKPDNLFRFLEAGIIYPLCYEENVHYLDNRQRDIFDRFPKHIPVFASIQADKDDCVVEIRIDEYTSEIISDRSDKAFFLLNTPIPVSWICALHFSSASARKKFQGMISGINAAIPTEWYKASGRRWSKAKDVNLENIPEVKQEQNQKRLREFDSTLGMLAYVRHGRLLHYLTAGDKSFQRIPLLGPEIFAFIAFLTGNDFYINRFLIEFFQFRSGITDKTFRVLAGTLDSKPESGSIGKPALYHDLLMLLNELVVSGHDKWDAETVLRDWFNKLSSSYAKSGLNISEVNYLLELAEKAGEMSMGLTNMEELLSHPILKSSNSLAPVRLMMLLSGYRQRSAAYTAKEAFRNALFRFDNHLFNVNEKQLALLIAGKYYGYKVLPMLEPVKYNSFQGLVPQLNLKLNYADSVEMHLLEQVYSSVFVPGRKAKIIDHDIKLEKVTVEKEVNSGGHKLQLQYLSTPIGNVYRLALHEVAEDLSTVQSTLTVNKSDTSETLLRLYVKVHLSSLNSLGSKELRETLILSLNENKFQFSADQIKLINKLIDLEEKEGH